MCACVGRFVHVCACSPPSFHTKAFDVRTYVRMCVHISKCVHVCAWVQIRVKHVCAGVNMYVHVRTYVQVSTHVWAGVCMCVHVRMYRCLHGYVRMHVCALVFGTYVGSSVRRFKLDPRFSIRVL